MLMHDRHRLPADHDSARIRERVAARGPLWDDAPGLGFKAFLLKNRALAAVPDVFATVAGLDPRTWRIARFTLRAGASADGAAPAILHLARPGLHALPFRSDTRTPPCP